jgi:hypothetical protein
LPDAPATGSVATRRSGPAVPAARTRCPRCAYALTGLSGAPDPATPYAATTAEIRCPECALLIPSGSICLVGGASSGVVDPNGARSAWVSLAGVIGAAAAMPLVVGVVLPIVLGKAGPFQGMARGQGIGAAAAVVVAIVAGWLVWRHWRRVGSSASGECAGARLRRAMVVRGGLHVWSGEPAPDARPRSVAGGDVRQVRSERCIPLFRRRGAGEAGAVRFATPIILWSPRPTPNIQDAGQSSVAGLAGSLWLPLPPGAQAADVAGDVMRVLRAPPERPAVAVPRTGLEPVATPTSAGDPNSLEVPVAVTAATAATPPRCPRCGAGLAPGAGAGAWWEPLPEAVSCGSCRLSVPAGAVVVGGSRGLPGTLGDPDLGFRWMLPAAVAVVVALVGVGGMVFFLASGRAVMGIAASVAMVLSLPVVILWAVRRSVPAQERPRARFQRCSEAWIVEPGRLRVVVRGRARRESAVPAHGITRFAFGETPISGGKNLLSSADLLSVRGRAPQLGIMGERFLHVPLPAEADTEAVIRAMEAALRAPASGRPG